MPAPSVFGWCEHRERQRAILERAADHFDIFDSGELRVQVGAAFRLEHAVRGPPGLEAGDTGGKAVLMI